MPRIPSITELQLRELAPAPLEDDFLSRLSACAEGTLTETTEADLAFEETLRAIRACTIPAVLQSSLMAAIQDTTFSVDEKIVLFHKTAKAPAEEGKVRRFFHPRMAAAAAVALLGAASAFLVPATESEKNQVASGYAGAKGTEFTSHFAPAGFGSNLSETREEGVVWEGKNRPHRVMRLTYMEKITMKNERGESFEVERPRYEYITVPEKID